MKNNLGIKIERYLEGHHVAALATIGSEGPWGAAVFYVNDGYTLYFLSSPTSRHAQQLAADPRIAVTIQENQTDWLKIKGVQLEGEARMVIGAEEEHARRLYGRKFPLVGMLNHAPQAIIKALDKVRWYRVVPRRLFFIDNSLGLGHREEIDLSSAGKDTNRHGT